MIGIVHGELLDAVTDEILQAGSLAARAEIVAELVHEMRATVAWLHDNGHDLDASHADELTSLTRLAEVAEDHRRRMGAAGQEAASR